MGKWISLIMGSCLGGLARYTLSCVIYRIGGSNFPYGTLAVNLLGCFLIGFLNVLAEEKFLLSPNLRVLLMVGFCGAFTTFSTFMLETTNLIKDGQSLLAFVNISFSIIAGFILFRAGVLLAESI